MKNGLRIDENGIKRYFVNNELHREDGPAIVYPDGSNSWWLNNELHRVDSPAEELVDGGKFWWLNGERHREDGPAEEYTSGNTFWYMHNKKHRVDGPAEEWSNGAKYWFLNDKQLIHPDDFKTMEEFFQELNDNEAYSLQWINDFNGLIEIIKEPSDKQKRLHAMRWKI